MTRPFDPRELSGAEGDAPTPAEMSAALAVAGNLETTLAANDIHPSLTFVDRVMDAVAVEPLPQPAIAAGSALRGGRLGAMAAALADSWRVAFSGGRPLAVRAQAAAFVLVVVLALGSLGGIAAVGAVRLLGPSSTDLATPSSGPEVPSARPAQNPAVESSDEPEPSESSEPSDGTEPSEPAETDEPGGTDRPGGTQRPSRTPRPTRTLEPHATDDHGGRGGGAETPEPTETPELETP
jgi:hypothetical protein